MATPPRPARVPSRWFVVTAWPAHRAIHWLTAGGAGCGGTHPGADGEHSVLHSTGRRSGKERSAIRGERETAVVVLEPR